VPPRDPHALANALDAARDLQFPADMLIARAAAFSSAACTASFLSLFRKTAVAEPARTAPAYGRLDLGASDRRHVRLSLSLEQSAGLLIK
jgi:hypothetical protein